MDLKILNEFNFIKSRTDVCNDYFFDCYNVKYDKKDVLSLELRKEQYSNIEIPQISAKFKDELFENLFMLECIKNASSKEEKFTFVELGAGYGRYSARAFKIHEKKDVKIIAVEADPFHFRMMLKHFKYNNINGPNIETYNNIISNKDSFMDFYISSKDLKEISNETAKNWFGQSIVHDWEKKINPVPNFFKNLFFYISNFYKVPFFKYIQFYQSDFSSIKVKAISLEKIGRASGRERV